jgi:REase_DpnII-MboI
MPFHVMIWPKSTEQQLLKELYAFNLSEEQLRERFIDPHDRGDAIVWSGRTLPGGDISYLRVGYSDFDVDETDIRSRFVEYEAFEAARDVSNDWVIRPPGSLAQDATSTEAGPTPAQLAGPSAAHLVVNLCRRFDAVRSQLLRRHSSRGTLEVADEYDVQDLMHSLLLINFTDVRAEAWNPPYLGGASRTDFLLPQEGLIVEVKKTRPSLRDAQVGEQLAADVTRYADPAANRGAGVLVCFVHDPDHFLTNPTGLENDLSLTSSERLQVIGVVG